MQIESLRGQNQVSVKRLAHSFLFIYFLQIDEEGKLSLSWSTNLGGNEIHHLRQCSLVRRRVAILDQDVPLLEEGGLELSDTEGALGGNTSS